MKRYRGEDLRILRLRKRLRASDVARAMGVSRQRVCQLEAARWPSESAAERVRTAIKEAAAER
jgi:transcriptional regulator with XRE-family HTH domain